MGYSQKVLQPGEAIKFSGSAFTLDDIPESRPLCRRCLCIFNFYPSKLRSSATCSLANIITDIDNRFVSNLDQEDNNGDCSNR